MLGDLAESPLGEISPELMALLRRHMLLMPAIKAVVVDELVSGVVLERSHEDGLISDWLAGRDFDAVAEESWRVKGLSPADLRWNVLRSERLLHLARDRFSAKTEAHFLKRKPQLDHVTYSLVRTRDAGLARELYLRLVSGEATFAELAALYSEGPERNSSGVIGPKPMSSAHPLLAERLRTGRNGEVMEPLQVDEWSIVVRRDRLDAAVFDAKMADRMAMELLDDSIQSTVMTRFEQLNQSF